MLSTLLFAASFTLAQAARDPSATPKGDETFPLWEGKAPLAVGGSRFDKPQLTLFKARQPNGAAVVICPGGGYGFLATDHEGKQAAEWLNSIGVAGIMVKYRLGPKYRHPAPLTDAQRAIRTVRAKAKEWNIDPHRVGILGFSAGGHLA